MRTGFERNGIAIGVENLPGKKKVALTVYPDTTDMNAFHKVGSFESTEDAAWFMEMIEEMFSRVDPGLVESAASAEQTVAPEEDVTR